MEGEDDSQPGPNISRKEVINANKLLKNNRASGSDEVPAEIIQLISEEQIDIL